MRAVVVGAGFSVPAGVPVARDIMRRVVGRIIARGGQGGMETALSEFARDYIIGQCNRKEFNRRLRSLGFEDLATTIDAAIARTDWTVDGVNPFAARSALVETVVGIVGRAVDAFDPGLYRPALEGLRRQGCAVVSLNWDTVVEAALGDEVLVTGADVGAPRSQGRLKLLKLHGSIDWGACSRCRAVTRLEVWSKVPPCPGCAGELSLPRVMRRVVLVPSILKEVENPTLAGVWDQAYRVLASADEVDVVGYSLPYDDHEVRYLLTRAMVAGPRRAVRVWLGGDEADRVQARWQRLFGWGTGAFRQSGAEGFLASVVDD